MLRRCLTTLPFAALLWVGAPACKGAGPGAPPDDSDAGGDAGSDAGSDAGFDAGPPPAPGFFQEKFTWQGNHAATIADGGSTTVHWNPDAWDIRGLTDYLSSDVTNGLTTGWAGALGQPV